MELHGKVGPIDISEQTISALQVKFPTKSVEPELLKAGLWLLRNTSSRPANIWRFLDHWFAKAPDVVRPPPVMVAWWTTDDRTINQGAAVGCFARPGESMAAYRTRIADKMRAA